MSSLKSVECLCQLEPIPPSSVDARVRLKWGKADVIDFTVFIKPERKRNSRLASMLQSPNPWFDNFRCSKSLSRFVSEPRSTASATAVVIASSCSWANVLISWLRRLRVGVGFSLECTLKGGLFYLAHCPTLKYLRWLVSFYQDFFATLLWYKLLLLVECPIY